MVSDLFILFRFRFIDDIQIVVLVVNFDWLQLSTYAYTRIFIDAFLKLKSFTL